MITLNDPSLIANLLLEVQKQGIKLKSLEVICSIYVGQPIITVNPEMYDCMYKELKARYAHTEDEV